MDNEQEPWWEVWGTRLINVVVVAVLASFILLYDMPGRGRLWDKVAAFLPFASTTDRPGMPAPKKVLVAASEAGGSRTLIVSEQQPAAQPAAAPEAGAAPAAAPAPHLSTRLRTISTYEEGQRTSAGASAAPAAAPQAAAPAAPAAAPQAAAATPENIAARASYGAASRGEVMGRAAGPVYNIKGKSKK